MSCLSASFFLSVLVCTCIALSLSLYFSLALSVSLFTSFIYLSHPLIVPRPSLSSLYVLISHSFSSPVHCHGSVSPGQKRCQPCDDSHIRIGALIKTFVDRRHGSRRGQFHPRHSVDGQEVRSVSAVQQGSVLSPYPCVLSVWKDEFKVTNPYLKPVLNQLI